MPALLRVLGPRRISLLSMYKTGSWCSPLARSQATAPAAVPLQPQSSVSLRPRQQNVWQEALPLPTCAGCPCSINVRMYQRSSNGSFSSKRQPLACQAASQPVDSNPEQPKPSTMLTIPTILTLARVAAIPALIAAWFWQDPAASAWVTGLFVAASVTDWLDGYLARKLDASSPFGAFLDPVADKLMVATVLVLLSTQPLAAGPLAGNAWVMPVATLIIIGREITMSALREWAATMGPAARSAVAVNAWGKWKTATQMVALTCLLFTREGASSHLAVAAATAAVPLLAIASYLTAHSLVVYMAGLWKFMK